MTLIDQGTIDAIQAALAPVAAKIGEGATYVWTTVVKQQYVYGVSSLIWALFLFILTSIAWFFAVKAAKISSRNERTGEEEAWAAVAIVSGITGLIFPVIGMICLSGGVMHVLNPGYYALQFFLQLGQTAANN